jgi:hypothetical protein
MRQRNETNTEAAMKTQTTQTFEERITDQNYTKLAPEFIQFVTETAKLNDKTPTQVWLMWREYASHGMSTLISEFVEWYGLKVAVRS